MAETEIEPPVVIATSRIITDPEECKLHKTRLGKATCDKQRFAYLRKLNENQLALLPLDMAIGIMENPDNAVKKIAYLDLRIYSEDIPAIVKTLKILTLPKSCFTLLTALISSQILLHIDEILKIVMTKYKGIDSEITSSSNDAKTTSIPCTEDIEEVDAFLARLFSTFSEKVVMDYVPEIRVSASKAFALLKNRNPNANLAAKPAEKDADVFRLLHFWENGICVFDEETVKRILENPTKYYGGNCDWLARKCGDLLMQHRAMKTMLTDAPLGPPPEKIKPKQLCVLCSQAERQVIFIPCGHYRVCFNCGDQITKAPIPVCPFCKAVVKDKLLVLD